MKILKKNWKYPKLSVQREKKLKIRSENADDPEHLIIIFFFYFGKILKLLNFFSKIFHFPQ